MFCRNTLASFPSTLLLSAYPGQCTGYDKLFMLGDHLMVKQAEAISIFTRGMLADSARRDASFSDACIDVSLVKEQCSSLTYC